MNDEYVLKKDCSKTTELCRAANLKPLMDEVKEIKTKVESLENGQTQLLIGMAKLPELLTEKLDNRYADKKTVDDIKSNINWIVKIVISAVVIALLGLVVIK